MLPILSLSLILQAHKVYNYVVSSNSQVICNHFLSLCLYERVDLRVYKS